MRAVEHEKRSIGSLQRSCERRGVEPTLGEVINQRSIGRNGCEHSVRRAHSRRENVDDTARVRKGSGVLAILGGVHREADGGNSARDHQSEPRSFFNRR